MTENEQIIPANRRSGCHPLSRLLARLFPEQSRPVQVTALNPVTSEQIELLPIVPAEVAFEPGGIPETKRDKQITDWFRQMVMAIMPGADVNMNEFYSWNLEAAVTMEGFPADHAENMRRLFQGQTMKEIINRGIANITAGNIWLRTNSSMHGGNYTLEPDQLCRYSQVDVPIVTSTEGIPLPARMIPILINGGHVVWQDISHDLSAEGIARVILPRFNDVTDIITSILVAEYQLETARYFHEPVLNHSLSLVQ